MASLNRKQEMVFTSMSRFCSQPKVGHSNSPFFFCLFFCCLSHERRQHERMKMEREDRMIRKDSLEGGTELVDVFKILSGLPEERLQSLTLKLHTLEGNGLVMQHLWQYLSERVNIGGGTVSNFTVDRTAMTEDNFIDLARIFTVLAEEKLCETFLRDCAYRKALKACEHMAGTYKEGHEYPRLAHLKKEAENVCGPQIEDNVNDPFFFTNFPSGKNDSSHHESNTALNPLSNHSLPSSLHTYISQSFPSHLEISVPLASNKVITSTLPDVPTTSALESSSSIKTQTNTPKCLTNMEEEESVFYSFVILHAEEDVDLAERLKDKLEALNIGCGATSSHFAIPGKSTLTCIEDAIDNSAFTLLLLTNNFNTRLLEMETNSALMNSINNQHKYNTVIPLHPKENVMLKEKMPKILQILVPLKENKMFENQAKKALNPAKIEYQRQVWSKEQRLKANMRRKERARHHLKLQRDYVRGSKELDELLQEHNLNLPLGERNIQHPLTVPRPNIHIENASYIIIGNDSQMTVGLDCNSFGDQD